MNLGGSVFIACRHFFQESFERLMINYCRGLIHQRIAEPGVTAQMERCKRSDEGVSLFIGVGHILMYVRVYHLPLLLFEINHISSWMVPALLISGSFFLLFFPIISISHPVRQLHAVKETKKVCAFSIGQRALCWLAAPIPWWLVMVMNTWPLTNVFSKHWPHSWGEFIVAMVTKLQRLSGWVNNRTDRPITRLCTSIRQNYY